MQTAPITLLLFSLINSFLYVKNSIFYISFIRRERRADRFRMLFSIAATLSRFIFSFLLKWYRIYINIIGRAGERMERNVLLSLLEKNARMDTKDLADILLADEASVIHEMS